MFFKRSTIKNRAILDKNIEYVLMYIDSIIR